MDAKDQELYQEEQRQLLIDLKEGIVNLAAEMRAVKDAYSAPDEVTVTNQPDEVTIKNMVDLEDKIIELGVTIGNAIVENSYKPAEVVEVSNLNDKVEIKNIDDLKKYFDGLAKAIKDNQPIVNVAKQDIIFPTDPKKPIAVRLSDGKEFYKAMMTIAGGGGTYTIQLNDGSRAVPVVNPNGTLIGATTNYQVRVDDYSTANVTYLGKAAIGAATSANVWQIKKIDEATGVVVTWADGDDEFNNIFDDRTSLSYS